MSVVAAQTLYSSSIVTVCFYLDMVGRLFYIVFEVWASATVALIRCYV